LNINHILKPFKLRNIMADPFVAEIRIFPFNFAPRGWASCDGQILPLSQNTALFSLLGTTYGGDGKSSFALPNLQGSVPMHPGQGPGLSLYDLGQSSGAETVTLLSNEMPSHNHVLRGVIDDSEGSDPTGQAMAKASTAVYSPSAANTTMAANALAPTGGSLPHNNMMPYLTYYFTIALQGVFPPRG
jgi:microcystin-dependent protein